MALGRHAFCIRVSSSHRQAGKLCWIHNISWALGGLADSSALRDEFAIQYPKKYLFFKGMRHLLVFDTHHQPQHIAMAFSGVQKPVGNGNIAIKQIRPKHSTAHSCMKASHDKGSEE